MGQNQLNASLSCSKCRNHYLIEILSNEYNISTRRYCNCGEFTRKIKHHIDFLLSLKYYRICSSCKANVKTKYCYDCKKFLCEICLNFDNKNHRILLSKFSLTCCKYHYEERIVCFCKQCKKAICFHCINQFHKNHEIKFMKDLNLTDEMVNNYKNRQIKFFELFENYLYSKYGQKIKIKTYNLLLDKYGNIKPLKYEKYKSLNEYEKQVLLTLKLLQTMLDLYNYYKLKDRLTYQIIANIVKHMNIELIIIPPQKPNNINLKINLIDEEKRKNQLLIEYEKLLNNKMLIRSKIIKLINGDLCAYQNKEKKMIFLKNFIVQDYHIFLNDDVNDFIQLKNENLAILLCNKNILIYTFKSNVFHLEKEIQLDKNKKYYKIRDINNSIAVLSDINDRALLIFLKYPEYDINEIDLSTEKSGEGNIINISNLIVICFEMNNLCKIILYDINNKKIETIEIKNKFYINKSNVNCFEINKEKILLSTSNCAYLINIKTKQIEANISYLYNLNDLVKIGNYTLGALDYSYICQINPRTWEILNYYFLDYSFIKKGGYYIIDAGNNFFISNYFLSGATLFKFK